MGGVKAMVRPGRVFFVATVVRRLQARAKGGPLASQLMLSSCRKPCCQGRAVVWALPWAGKSPPTRYWHFVATSARWLWLLRLQTPCTCLAMIQIYARCPHVPFSDRHLAHELAVDGWHPCQRVEVGISQTSMPRGLQVGEMMRIRADKCRLTQQWSVSQLEHEPEASQTTWALTQTRHRSCDCELARTKKSAARRWDKPRILGLNATRDVQKCIHSSAQQKATCSRQATLYEADSCASQGSVIISTPTMPASSVRGAKKQATFHLNFDFS